jgi:hypothetical protein
VNNLLVFLFKFLLVEVIEVKVTLMFLGIAVLRTENVFTTALDSQEAYFLLACPTLSLIVLGKANH